MLHGKRYALRIIGMSEPRKQVAILLSTFNGEQFLPQQLDSLYAQEGVDCHIFVRDDGSCDGTLAILHGYARDHGRLRLTAGSNIGFVHSFFTLLQAAGDEYDFYFFCDQDDVWHPRKALAAVAMLEQRQQCGPAMYCGRTEYVDEQLRPLGFSPAYACSKVGWGNALVQNIATGCTVALNNPARNLLVTRLPRQCLAHDWWAYLVVSAFGEVIYDPRSYIQYRQHGSNAIGMQQSGYSGLMLRVRRFLKRRGFGILDQLDEFMRLYGNDLSGERQEQANRLLRSRHHWLQGLRVAGMGFYWRMARVDSLILRVLLVLRKY